MPHHPLHRARGARENPRRGSPTKMSDAASGPFALTLFSVDPDFICRAVDAGVREIIVDCEFRDKHRRQAEADTEINHDTMEDLRRVRASTQARVLCRINAFGEDTPREIAEAIEGGVDEILL